jgi:hypothetical protein
MPTGVLEKQLLGNAIPGLDIPMRAEELTPELLTRVIDDMYPGTRVTNIEFLHVAHYGEQMVSTSDRGKLRLTYENAPADLPTQLILKMKRDDFELGALYDTEVGFYRHFRDEVTIEAPRAVGAVYDPDTMRFVLLLDDLTLKGARFLNAVQHVTVEEVDSILDSQARLHAHFWDSPRFRSDLAGIQSHVAGRLHDHFNRRHPRVPIESVAEHPWKQELLARVGKNPPELWAETLKAQAYQATLPQTIVHGDAHIGNTYLLPDGTGGLVDWQLTVRGAWVHDVNYTIITALPPEVARANEQDLLKRYLARLRECGVASPPSFDEAWLAYRMGPAWDLEVGWLIVPDFSYGPEISRTNHYRTAQAYIDRETAKVIKAHA